jgi:hypothetical protein
MRVTQNSMSTDKWVALQIELEFRNVDFCGGSKTLEARERINNKLHSHMTPIQGIEPESQWWEAGALPLRHPCFPNYLLRSTYEWEWRLNICSRRIGILKELKSLANDCHTLSAMVLVVQIRNPMVLHITMEHTPVNHYPANGLDLR